MNRIEFIQVRALINKSSLESEVNIGWIFGDRYGKNMLSEVTSFIRRGELKTAKKSTQDDAVRLKYHNTYRWDEALVTLEIEDGVVKDYWV